MTGAILPVPARTIAAVLRRIPRGVAAVGAIGWAATIFALSAQPTLPSLGESPFANWVYNAAHAPVFGILAMLCLLAFAPAGEGGTPPATRSFWLAFVVASLYAATDEWHQSLVAGRIGSPIDFATDVCGAAAAVGLLRWSLFVGDPMGLGVAVAAVIGAGVAALAAAVGIS